MDQETHEYVIRFGCITDNRGYEDRFTFGASNDTEAKVLAGQWWAKILETRHLPTFYSLERIHRIHWSPNDDC